MNRIFCDNRYKPFLATLCAVGWSLAYPLIKVGYQAFQITPDDLGAKLLFAGIRFCLAGILVVTVSTFRKTALDVKNKTSLWWLILLAVVNTTLHYMFSYIGLGYNPSGRSTILDSMGGFFLILLSTAIFADDRLSVRKIIGCVLGVSGIVLINIQPGGSLFADFSFRGDGMILLNALCAAFGGIITRFVSRKMNMLPATGYSMTIGGVLLLLAGWMIGKKTAWALNGTNALILLALVLISAVCFAVYNELLACHPISEIAIYNALIPVLGVVFAALILHEALKWQYFLSVAIVAIGICLVNRDESR